MSSRTRGRLATIAAGDASPGASSAIAVALKSRIAVVAAAAGWGKSTAVGKALQGTDPVWLDLSRADAIPDFCATDWNGRTVVVDGAHVLGHNELASLIDSATRMTTVRWIFITRRIDALPVARWIGSGDAGVPVVHEDLALSLPEIVGAAKELGVRTDAAAMQFVQTASGGWPIAVRFALVVLDRCAGDLSRAGTMTSSLLREFSSTEILAVLTPRQRELVFDVAMLGTIDEALLAANGSDDPATDFELLRAAPVPWLIAGDGLAMHAAFHRVVLAEIPPAERRTRALRAAAILRSRGQVEKAFDLIRQHAPEKILAELRAHGLALLEAGQWDEVEAAVRTLPQRERHDDPVILCLRAEIEAQAGDPHRARALHERAAMLAKGKRVAPAISRRYAIYLINQGSMYALDAIVPALNAGTQAEKVEARGVLATALALAGRIDEARVEGRRAVDAATELDDDELITRCLQRMSYVEYQAGDIAEAERYALDTARLAHRVGAWSHFVCAQSVLFSSAIGARDDHAAALWHAQQIALGAQHTRDRRHRSYALGAQYVLEVERGNRDRALELEAQIPQQSSGRGPEFDVCVARCIRRSWAGEFEQALGQLDRLGDRVDDLPERRLWNAMRAMLAAFAGRERTAFAHLRACGKTPSSGTRESEIRNARADCYAAVAQIFLGHPEAALRRLPRNQSTSQLRAWTSFARDLAALDSPLGAKSTSTALDRLRAGGQGGFALAVETALAGRTRGDVPVSLTATELRVLEDMGRGRTAKIIALDHGRSVHTIRNQIKAIIKKLGASGSIEAVARARRNGLIE